MSLSKIHDIKPIRHEKPLYKSEGFSARPEVYRRPTTGSSHYSNIHKSKNNGKGVWYITAILLVGLFFGLSVFFTSATITIIPVSKEIPLNERFVANKKSILEELTFDSMLVEGSVSEVVSSESKQIVQEKATGMVRIFNEHSSEPQSLLIDTRLVDDAGRIYKTVEKTTVPGMKTINGKSVAGFVDVGIYADLPGESHNKTEITKLHIIGFKEAKSQKYETIYAETLGAIAGGFEGEKFVVEEGKKQEIISRLTQKLQSDLYEKSIAQIPDQTLFAQDLSILTNTAIQEKVLDTGEIEITLTGALFNILFNKIEFEKYILGSSIVGINREEAYIANLEDLKLSYIDPKAQTKNPDKLETLGFEINDVLQIISIINKESFVFDIVGQKRKDFQTVITKYPGIKEVSFDINPFWKSHFPEADEDIEIIIQDIEF